ncbi:MAG: PHP domain-containing protein, partial [Rhodospirillales bacterium]|nr:PHP domain-containing protein [Acetobacter sp.]
MGAYIELHARSAFSFLLGASLPGNLVSRVAELGLSGLAICDRNGFYGSPRQWTASLEAGVRAIYGCELTLEDGSALPVLVRTTAGYQSLCRLLSHAALRAPKGMAAVLWRELEEVAGGSICLTGDEEGPIVQALLRNDLAGAETMLRRLVRIFGSSNVYVEVQRHLRRGERWLNARLVDLARATGTPLLATNGVLYSEPAGRRVLDIFTCARSHTSLDQAGTALSLNGERHLKSPAQMQALFADLPVAITNTARVA